MTCGVILLYYIYISFTYIHYYYILLLHTILFLLIYSSSSSQYSPLPILPLLIYTLLFLPFPIFPSFPSLSNIPLFSSFTILPFPSSSLPSLFLSSPPPSNLPFPPVLFHSHSKYTCRHFHFSILSLHSRTILQNNLTPHVLSEWMVEVCRFDKYRYQVHVGVDEYPVLFVFRAGVRF